MASSAYLDVRNAIADEGSDARVEVNQRALIDKILARYASAGAVYRELLQNSNDADATDAEILITTSTSEGGGKEVVSQVIYRNNGLPFRTQDWARLRKIAEGNPDASKVGAFGVGAYTMFSICEEPLVVSGKKGQEEAMAFFWKGDSLWTKTGKAPDGIINMSATLNGSGRDQNTWTSFILPSRDPYPLPDLVEFGKFLTASLTFTQCLKNIRVYVNSTLQMNIQKTIIESHTIVTPKASSWWKNDGAVTSSSGGLFTLGKGSDLTQTSVEMSVSVKKKSSSNSEMETSKVRARYSSAVVNTKIPSEIEKRMMRVTKKKPPKELTVQIFLGAVDHSDNIEQSSKLKKKSKKSMADLITQSFAPTSGSGRVFIGFRTSQTTGLGIHLAAPLVPTVEREAIDFVDPALREFNSELLEVSGILMRLALENEMFRLGSNRNWKEEQEAWEAQRQERQKEEEEEKKSEADDAESAKGSIDDKTTTISCSLYSFASFMARGVKNSVVEVVKAVPELLGEDNETTELLNPIDDRPLCVQERDAILLMQAYCPRQSTPDSLVGQCLAKGFSRCMASTSPPVLTIDGVARGVDARLPQNGMEAFGIPHAVRRVMLKNAKEYHMVIANCPTMNMDDLIRAMKDNVLSEDMLIRLLKWYPKYSRLSTPRRDKSLQLKEAIRYYGDSKVGGEPSDAKAEVLQLESILYFAQASMNKKLPLPETVLPERLVASIGTRTLEDNSFHDWFQPLPFDIWAGFISEHSCMRDGCCEDDDMRILILATLSKHFDSLPSAMAKRRFVELLPLTSPCLPFDTTSRDDKLDASNIRAAVPNELYLPDTDLSAFSGLQTFHKVSKRLKKEGVSDDFLLAMGVRKTIKIDFLFLHLDTLNWNDNPKPLIKYLIEADLSPQDLVKLRSTRYLPAADNKTTVYAPSQLYLNDKELDIFPFVKFLQWPLNEGMSAAERNFLSKLGVRTEPPLNDIMGYLEKESMKSPDARDDVALTSALQYLTQRLGPKGAYVQQFHHARVNFLPCIRQNLETGEVIKEIKSPLTCYFNPTAMIMGFSVLDPMLADTEQIGVRMKINRDPSCQVLLRRLLQLVDISKAKIDQLERQSIEFEEKEKIIEKILVLFEGVFLYLSSRTSDFQKRHLSELAKRPFIPCKCRNGLQFYTADQVFFVKRQSETAEAGDSIAELLFQQIEYNAFLSFAGVKTEPSLEELFALMMEKPDEVLDSLGEPKYKMLLRRIAANPPFKRITAEIRSAPFLLGYLIVDEDESNGDEAKARSKAQYLLAKADDIHIVDNAFLRRQFPMLISPMEQTLEEFYRRIGSKYVSEVVKKDFEVLGSTRRGTPLVNSCADRITERRPLLLSPSITSRPLVSNASSILDKLEIFQADSIRAIYSFERSSKIVNVTCCSKLTKRNSIAIFITSNLEMFDLGSCIGELILQHCELKDAFFLTSLLEASIGTLRNRGFPVDRIVKPTVVEAKAKPRIHNNDITSNETNNDSSSSASNNGGSATTTKRNTTDNSKQANDGFDTILKNMYPQIDSNEIRQMLGPNPTKEKAAQVAYELSEKVKEDAADSKMGDEKRSVEGPTSPKKKSVLGKMREGLGPVLGLGDKLPQKLNKRFGSSVPPLGEGVSGKLDGNVGAAGQGSQGDCRVGREGVNGQGDAAESKGREDAVQKSLEAMLQQSIQSSRSVNSSGVTSQETLLQNLPEGIDCGSNGCEVVPAQNIRPFKGPYGNSKSRNGIRIMAAASSTPTTNEAFGFLSSNFDAVNDFSVVIGNLVQIFQLNISSVAIYYDPNGNTIAFNSNKAFHFNFRFFHAIHRNDWNSKACYSYWYTVFCHELAHNLVSAHNKEHGKYTESIVMLYLPSLIDFLGNNFVC